MLILNLTPDQYIRLSEEEQKILQSYYKKVALSQEQYNKLSDEEKEPLSYEDSPLDEYCGNLTLNYLTQLIDNNDIGSKMTRYLINKLSMLIIQLKLLKQGH
jgi:hypothetical protein